VYNENKIDIYNTGLGLYYYKHFALPSVNDSLLFSDAAENIISH